MGIVMILFSLYMGNIQISSDLPAFLESVQMGFIIFAALSFISIFIQFSARHGKSQAASG
jgi:hypothetical protein